MNETLVDDVRWVLRNTQVARIVLLCVLAYIQTRINEQTQLDSLDGPGTPKTRSNDLWSGGTSSA